THLRCNRRGNPPTFVFSAYAPQSGCDDVEKEQAEVAKEDSPCETAAHCHVEHWHTYRTQQRTSRNVEKAQTYAPQSGCDDVEKEQFWTELQDHIAAVPRAKQSCFVAT
ncbi:hypothetical protein COOONC_04202, partial [Cooperia oncophora]